MTSKCTVREIVGAPPLPATRLHGSQLVSFQRSLEIADQMTLAYFATRGDAQKRKREDTIKVGTAAEKAPLVDLGFDEDGVGGKDDVDGEDGVSGEVMLSAILKTVAAMTNSDPPDEFETVGSAMKWVKNAVLKEKNEAVDSTRREGQLYTLDPDQTTTALDLMTQLNTLLSQTRSI